MRIAVALAGACALTVSLLVLGQLLHTAEQRKLATTVTSDAIWHETSNATNGSGFHNYPLSTRGSWIVRRDTGERVRLSCINWPAHMETMLPEGLASASVDHIVSTIVDRLQLNCVRMTVSVDMFVPATNWNAPIAVGMSRYMSPQTRQRFYALNPQFGNGNDDDDDGATTVADVMAACLRALERRGVMVLLDNHISRATWCCGEFDGNRWFNEGEFQVEPWLTALAAMAQLGARHRNVVGIGLRNEVNTFKLAPYAYADYYKYMRMGAETVHRVDPGLLISVGGMQYSTWLRHFSWVPLFAPHHPISGQLVYEMHFYNLFYINWVWSALGEQTGCTLMQWLLDFRAGAVAEGGSDGGVGSHAIWLGEFGMDVARFQPGSRRDATVTHHTDPAWFKCLSGWVRERDVDWAYWLLPVHLYYRDGQRDFMDDWGVMSGNGSVNSQLAAALRPIIRGN